MALAPPGPIRAQEEQPTATPAATDAPAPAIAAAAPAASFQLYLPLVSDGRAAPDLVFDPPALELGPDEEASTVVRVDPPTDLGGASFDLDGAHDGVTSVFEPAPGGITGTLTLRAADGSPEREVTLNVLGRKGEKTWVGSLQLSVSSSKGKQRFVDPAKGKDSNDGSQSKPFKTLAKALSKAKKGDTITLAPGVYSAATNGERFPTVDQKVEVPSGVTILGTQAGDTRTVLRGTGLEAGLVFKGDATVKDITFDNLAIGAFANKGRQTLERVVVQTIPSDTSHETLKGIFGGSGILLQGSAQTTIAGSLIVVDADNATGVTGTDKTRLTLDQTKITGVAPNCRPQALGVRLGDEARANIQNGSLIENIAGPSLFLNTRAAAIVDSSSVLRFNPNDCSPGPLIHLVTNASATIKNSQIVNLGKPAQDGILHQSTDILAVQISHVSGFFQAGIALDKEGTVLVASSTIDGNGAGIRAFNPKTRVLLDKPTITKNDVGVVAAIIDMHGCAITGNGIGVIAGSADANLGTADIPGRNTIANNTVTGVAFDAGFTQGTVQAIGNVWNPNTQLTGADGRYGIAFSITGDRSDALARGKNFQLPRSAAVAIQP